MKPSSISNKELAELLRSIAAAYLLLNENKFKIIAYEKAADAVEHLARELQDIYEDGKFQKIPGIGPSISAHLTELFSTGKSTHFDEILGGIPPTVFFLMRVPGIGPKKAFKLVQELKLHDVKTVLADLKKAAQDGKIRVMPSFGEKSEADVLAAVELYEKTQKHDDRMPLPYAHKMAQDIINHLKQLKVKRIDALGSLRRMVPTIGDIDIAVSYDGNPEDVVNHFLEYPKKISVDNKGEKKASIIIPPRIRVDLRVQDAKSYGSMLQYFTGSKAHNVKLREYALRKKLSLSEWGIKKVGSTDGFIEEFDTEEKFYEFIGVPYIPPEIREGSNEIDLALKQKLPELVKIGDIKGEMHIHSSYDINTSYDLGANTYEEIVDKAISLGYEYVGFADHNPKQSDLSAQQVIDIMKRRKEHIDTVLATRKKKIGYFIGLETDILPDGNLPLPEKAYEYVDFLIVSIHSSFRQPREQMTKRVLKALSHPKVKIYGHPTGRLINKRAGIDLEWDPVFEQVLKAHQALEINSWPERLDLPDILVREAIQKGIQCIIDTDAHAVDQMDNMLYGISVARRGWARASDIINTQPLADFQKWLVS